MTDRAPLPLHLHTPQTICDDLVANIGIAIDEHEVFRLQTDTARAILAWYQANRSKWGANVQLPDIDAIVNASRIAPKQRTVAQSQSTGLGKRPIYRIKKLTVHRFAGTHAYGKPNSAPLDLEIPFTHRLTLLEGGNGSGKTSILNALTWCMSGLVIRPQRPPEEGATEYDVKYARADADGEHTTHSATVVSPLPNPDVALPGPGDKQIFSDTWVEAEFENDAGKTFTLRREQRSDKGRARHVQPDTEQFGLDPIAFRICTLLPAMIPYIKLGSASELGRAVAQLTGLSELTGLAKHAARSSERALSETRATQAELIVQENIKFSTARTDLHTRFGEFPDIKPSFSIPTAENASEKDTEDLSKHFQSIKADWFGLVRDVLGESYDPNSAADTEDVERNIGPAIGQLSQIGKLTSSERLRDLGRLTDDQLASSEALLEELLSQALVIAELAATTTTPTRRHQLYARIAGWLREGTDEDRAKAIQLCVVCSQPLAEVIDPETGVAVSEHVSEALKGQRDFVGQTTTEWVRGAQGRLAAELPEALRREINQSLPSHPRELVRSILLEELFDAPCFKGKLASLQTKAQASYDKAAAALSAEMIVHEDKWPTTSAHLLPIAEVTARLRKAIAFARWRKDNGAVLQKVFEQVVGKPERPSAKVDEEKAEQKAVGRGDGAPSTLIEHLSAIRRSVDGAAPVKAALTLSDRMHAALRSRKQKVDRIAEIEIAASALKEIAALGGLVEKQVDGLRKLLHEQTTRWLERIYRKTQSAGHTLVSLDLSSTGHLGVMVGGGGMSAPADQIANASALRATLLAFFFAFWEHVKVTRGGFDLLLLDDPQELLDRENKERFASVLPEVAGAGTQLLLTTHDREFARQVVLAVNRRGDRADHRAVFPVNAVCSHIRLPISEEGLESKRKAFLNPDNRDVPLPAQEYAGEVRVYVEAGLASLFEEPAYAGPIGDLGLSDLIGAVRSKHNSRSLFFTEPVVHLLCTSQEFAAGSKVLRLLNKSHHPDRANLTFMHVDEVKDDLERVCSLVRNMLEEYRRWRKREPREVVMPVKLPFVPALTPAKSVRRIATLSAFAGSAGSGPGNDEEDVLSGDWFVGKALMRLNTHNFGFSAPINSLAIVDCEAGHPIDKSLVVAVHGDRVHARRLLRAAQTPGFIALVAETVDPRKRPPSLFLSEGEVSAHRVVGVLVDRNYPPALGTNQDAVAVDGFAELDRIEVAFGVKDDSALPLALPNQTILGGAALRPSDFEANIGQLVALALEDGRQLLKRVGPALPGELAHVRQFESIGGYGESFLAATEDVEGRLQGFPLILGARLVLGVLYHAGS